MSEVELISKHYMCKSDLALLPLTGLPKTEDIRSYMFWENYSIENYNLIIEIRNSNNDYYEILNKNTTIVECYEDKEYTYFILDMSIWALDIDQFLIGKYSKMSGSAKDKCIKFHNLNGKEPTKSSIFGIFYPKTRLEVLGNKTPIEYLISYYKLDGQDVLDISEIGSIYDKEKETLSKEINRFNICI